MLNVDPSPSSSRKTRPSFKDWTYNKLHGWDIYAKPITLAFNKKPAFATVPGGLCSMITLIFFILVLFAQSVLFYNGSNRVDNVNTTVAPYLHQGQYIINTT